MTRQSTAPALPALSPESAPVERAAQRISLRRSFVMCAVLAVFVSTAIWAVYSVAASQLGAWQAVPVAFAVAALLLLGVARHDRAQPGALKVDRNRVTAWDRTGTLLTTQGRVAGCSQWSNRLLILAVVQEDGRRRSLLLTADALPAGVFRELSVLGRRGAGA